MKSETIKKYQNALQEFVDFIKKSNGYVNGNEINYLRKKHQVSGTLWTDAVKLDIINKTGVSTWKVIVDKIEPIHVKRLIEYRREYMSIKANSKKWGGNLKKSFADKQPVQTKKLEKTISILWGLIILKY